jgi:hypothetical protein
MNTPEAELLDAAIAVARGAPLRRGTYVSHAKIYWPYIERPGAGIRHNPTITTPRTGERIMNDDIEYLDARLMRVHRAIARLNERAGPPPVTSAVATAARLSRDAATLAVRELEGRGYLRDAGAGAACCWQVTGKVPVQDPATMTGEQRAERTIELLCRYGQVKFGDDWWPGNARHWLGAEGQELEYLLDEGSAAAADRQKAS